MDDQTEPALVTQAAWAKRLGVSIKTFKRWRVAGRIPLPLDLPGWPRWDEKVVARVTQEIRTAGEGRHFRTAAGRRGQSR